MGSFVATAGTDQTIKVWNIQTGKEVSTLIGNADTPYARRVSWQRKPRDGRGSVPDWRKRATALPGASQPPRLSKSVATGEVYNIVASPDGTKIASVGGTRTTNNDISEEQHLRSVRREGRGPSGSPTRDKDRNVLLRRSRRTSSWAVTGDATGGVQIFDLKKAERRRRGNMPPIRARREVDIGVTADKKFVIATDDKEVKVGELKNGKLEVVAKGEPHKDKVRAIYVSPTEQERSSR